MSFLPPIDNYRNPWYNYQTNSFHPAVLACRNNIVLLDRRRIIGTRDFLLTYRKGPRKWAVYNASDTRHNGEWTAPKTRKEAIEMFVRMSLTAPNTVHPALLRDTIVEAEFKRVTESLPDTGE